MTLNSLALNNSTAIGGIGTSTYNVVSPGLYTLSFKSFLPYLESSGPSLTLVPAYQGQTITTVADVAGNLNSKYFTFSSSGDIYKYYAWYNSGTGVDPALSGYTGIEVEYPNDAEATLIADLTRDAIRDLGGASTYMSVHGSDNHIILTNLQVGTATIAANGTASPAFTYAITQTGSYGASPQSGLSVFLRKNGTNISVFGPPDPFQKVMAGQASINTAAADVISIFINSLSPADTGNSVKTIINLSQGGS